MCLFSVGFRYTGQASLCRRQTSGKQSWGWLVTVLMGQPWRIGTQLKESSLKKMCREISLIISYLRAEPGEAFEYHFRAHAITLTEVLVFQAPTITLTATLDFFALFWARNWKSVSCTVQPSEWSPSHSPNCVKWFFSPLYIFETSNNHCPILF